MKRAIVDPHVAFGPFRVLPRSSGGFAVCDERRAPGAQVVAVTRNLASASAQAKALHEQERVLA